MLAPERVKAQILGRRRQGVNPFPGVGARPLIRNEGAQAEGAGDDLGHQLRGPDPPPTRLLHSAAGRVTLRAETQQVIAELERVSGLPVQVLPVPDLGVMANTVTPPHATGGHVIQVRSDIPFKDYVVAVQCGHILRLLALPESQRFQLATADTASEWASKIVRTFMANSRKSSPPQPVLRTFTDQLLAGLFTQLRSIPIEMRIAAWLAADYPGLADKQAESLAAQQKEALSCLSPQVRAVVPDEIVSASILLNTAYALFCDRLLETTELQVPYAASGFKDLGQALLRIFDELPAEPSSDRALVDRWAQEIGLDGKYTWIPLPSPTARAS